MWNLGATNLTWKVFLPTVIKICFERLICPFLYKLLSLVLACFYFIAQNLFCLGIFSVPSGWLSLYLVNRESLNRDSDVIIWQSPSALNSRNSHFSSYHLRALRSRAWPQIHVVGFGFFLLKIQEHVQRLLSILNSLWFMAKVNAAV